MVHNAASGQKEKNMQMWKSGFVQKEISSSGRMGGYRWLQPCVVKSIYVVSQDTKAHQFVSLAHLHKAFWSSQGSLFEARL